MKNLWLKKVKEKLLPFHGTLLKIEEPPVFKKDGAGNSILVLEREAIRDTIVLQTADGYSHLMGEGGYEIVLDVPKDKVVLVSYEYER